MAPLRMLLSKLAGLFRKARREQQLDEDVREHLEMLTEENLRKGMEPEEARYAALRQFGNVSSMKEECRETWSIRIIEELVQDVRYGLRQLRRNPGFTAVAVLTLALGIGATTAIFSTIDDLVVRPLPYPAPHRIVALNEVKLDEPGAGWKVSLCTFTDWKKRSRSFDEMALADRAWRSVLEGPNGAQIFHGERVTQGYFKILGARTSLGRLFLPEEYAQYKGKGKLAVILSIAAWRRIFDSDPDILGKTVKISGHIFSVVGVMSADYHALWGETLDLWVPVTWRSNNRKARYYDVFG